MFKNDIVKNPFRSQKYILANQLPLKIRQLVRPIIAGAEMAFAVKVFFTVMVIIGLAFINPALFTLSHSGNQSASSDAIAQKLPLTATSYSTLNPSLLIIPSLKLRAPFELLGLNADHTIAVPKNDMSVGWFVYGAKPGEIGTSVVVGHLNSLKGRAIFANLNKIKPGDEILIQRMDKSVVVYSVDSISKFSQQNFPTETIYGSKSYPAIRLITCSGVYNKKIGRYSENLVVFASKK